MSSAIIEQIRQQFYASLGINEWTPISEAQAPGLIDQWEQYLYSYAQQQAGYPGGYGTTYPPVPRVGIPSPVYVPPGQRVPYPPGQIYSSGGGVYVGPPTPGSVVGQSPTPLPPVFRAPATPPPIASGGVRVVPPPPIRR